jgi:hypothetical protein
MPKLDPGPIGRSVTYWAFLLRQALDIGPMAKFPRRLREDVAIHLAHAVAAECGWDVDPKDQEN